MVLLRKKQDNRVMHWKNKHCIEERKKMYRYIIKNISNYYQLHLMADNGRFPLQILFFFFSAASKYSKYDHSFYRGKNPT